MIHRRRRADTTQRAIVAGLVAAGFEVHIVGRPVDLLVGHPSWGNRWQLLECKTATGKRCPRARVRHDQPEQNAFVARFTVPRVTSLDEALAALEVQR